MTQVWPASDSFGEGPTAIPPVGLPFYVRLVPWSTDPVHGSGGTGFSGASLVGSGSTLYSGWFGQATPVPGSASNPAAAAAGVTAITAPRLCSFMPRALSFLDITVRASYQLQSTDMGYVLANGASFWAGVGARLRDGSVQGSANSNYRLLGGSGYWMIEACDTGSGLGRKFLLLRVNGGTVTRLAESPGGASTFDAPTAISPSAARQIELEVVDEGSDVRVIGRWRYATSAADDVVLNVLDTSGSKLTQTGRTGLFLSSEYRVTSSPIRLAAPCANWFEIDDGVDIHFRDEWDRLAPILCANFAPGFSNAERTGKSLLSAWYADYQADGVTTLPAPTSDTLVFNPNNDLWVFSQRRADDPRRQDRTIVGRFDSTGLANAAVRGFGLFVRATQSSTSPSSCYHTRVTRDDIAGTSQVELWRISTDGQKMIARKTGLALGLDSNILHRLRVDTAPVPDPINGPAILTVELGGVAVALVQPPTPVAGISISSAGVVTDSSSFRVLSGNGEGFRVFVGSANPRTMILDTWDQEAEAGPAEQLPRDQITAAVGFEYSSTVGTLSLPTEVDVRVERVVSTIRHDLDSDHVYMAAMQDERRIWDVSIVGMSNDEREDLLDLIAAAKGVQGAFNWTTPEGTAVVVHFLEDRFDFEQIVPGRWSIAFRLQELFA